MHSHENEWLTWLYDEFWSEASTCVWWTAWRLLPGAIDCHGVKHTSCTAAATKMVPKKIDGPTN